MPLSGVGVHIVIQTYSHSSEVLVEFSCNFEGEFATWYGFTALGPIQRMDLPH